MRSRASAVHYVKLLAAYRTLAERINPLRVTDPTTQMRVLAEVVAIYRRESAAFAGGISAGSLLGERELRDSRSAALADSMVVSLATTVYWLVPVTWVTDYSDDMGNTAVSQGRLTPQLFVATFNRCASSTTVSLDL